jgi:Amt family ammonium transporter
MSIESISYIINTLYAIFAMTLIIFMVPGFAMLEAGIVRTKNVTAVLTINTLIYAIASLSFLLFGYSLALVILVSLIDIFLYSKSAFGY